MYVYTPSGISFHRAHTVFINKNIKESININKKEKNGIKEQKYPGINTRKTLSRLLNPSQW